jgi:hypothetical protein
MVAFPATVREIGVGVGVGVGVGIGGERANVKAELMTRRARGSAVGEPPWVRETSAWRVKTDAWFAKPHTWLGETGP